MKIPIAIVVMGSIGCSIDRSINPLTPSEESLLTAFQALQEPNRIRIADTAEPGERLLLCLTLVRKESQSLLPHQSIHLYHTNAAGTYEAANPLDESSAKLNGKAVSDEQGRIYVETILPGDYGSSPNNRHIHTTLFGARPEAYDIHFRQYANWGLRRFVAGSDQHFLAELKYTRDSTLVSFLTLEPKRVGQ